MAFFISVLLFLSVVLGGATPAVSQSSDQSEPMCYDWGESSEGAVSVLEGEAGWLSCPLFSHPSVYNYSSTQSTGHNLFWYRLPVGQDLEQPIVYSLRLSKDRERLWLQPATTEDSGQYICMLRNKSSCSKIAMRLNVLSRDEVASGRSCEPAVATAPSQAVIPLQEGSKLDCPDLQEAIKMADSDPNVTWYHGCSKYGTWNSDRQQKGFSLEVLIMLDYYQGLYYCTVQYQRRGSLQHFSRSINVTAVYPSSLPKDPSILHPTKDQVISVKQDIDVPLACRGLFPYLESRWDIWWTIDGKTVEQLADPHFSKTNRMIKYDYGDRTEESVLVIKDFQAEDLKREYNCSVMNQRGFATRRAQLEMEVSLPSVELGCGLGVTLLLMLVLFMVYHVFWLELLLLYRSWFGTDERHTDDKEYDVYISYARNGEEEQFVLVTLRRVLENELGYSVCIFDRDSLPGGNLSEAILLSMQQSRHLLFVLSPDYLAEKSLSLLECRLGLYLQHGHRASIVAVVYRSLSKVPCVEVAQLRQAATSTVTWRGSQSEPRRSRFWLRLRLALPVRPLAMGRRLIDSTSSHSDLAALALQRVQQIQNRNHMTRANESRRNSRTTLSQSRRHRQTSLRGSSKVRREGSQGQFGEAGSKDREEGHQHSTSCSGCVRHVSQMEAQEQRGAGLTAETEMQQVSHDRTDIKPDCPAATEPTSIPDSPHEAASNHAHIGDSTPDPTPSSPQQDDVTEGNR